jgi:valine dehydrogenase (NAD+)
MTIALGHPAFGVFERDDELAGAGHEQVVFCRDEDSGLRAVISIRDTTLGPALGRAWVFPYPNESPAPIDVLRLSLGHDLRGRLRQVARWGQGRHHR